MFHEKAPFKSVITQVFADDILGSVLGLQIDLADILTDNAQGKQNQAADGPDGADHPRPLR